MKKLGARIPGTVYSLKNDIRGKSLPTLCKKEEKYWNHKHRVSKTWNREYPSVSWSSKR